MKWFIEYLYMIIAICLIGMVAFIGKLLIIIYPTETFYFIESILFFVQKYYFEFIIIWELFWVPALIISIYLFIKSKIK